MIIIGSRGSDLALWQAHFFQDELTHLGEESRIEVIKTQGDKIQNLTFDKLEGKGFFTKELEDALLDGSIDIAVHSLKDLPTDPVPGLTLGGLSHRADPRDTLLINPNSQYNTVKEFVTGSPIIGTSSARRKAQLGRLFPEGKCVDIRGNVPTRIAKLESENLDGIILAQAGLDRLQLDIEKYQPFQFDVAEMVPAPGQGVLGYQTQTSNIKMRTLLLKLHHPDISACTNIERGVLNALDGGCQLPLGVHLYQDKAKNFISHTSYYDGSELHQLSHTQSTFDGLKELIIQELKAKTPKKH